MAEIFGGGAWGPGNVLGGFGSGFGSPLGGGLMAYDFPDGGFFHSFRRPATRSRQQVRRDWLINLLHSLPAHSFIFEHY